MAAARDLSRVALSIVSDLHGLDRRGVQLAHALARQVAAGSPTTLIAPTWFCVQTESMGRGRPFGSVLGRSAR